MSDDDEYDPSTYDPNTEGITDADRTHWAHVGANPDAVAAWVEETSVAAWVEETSAPDTVSVYADGTIVATAPHPDGLEHANHFRVGVKAWDGPEGARRSGKWSSSFQALWVEIDGQRVPGMIVNVKTKMRNDAFQEVTVKFVAGKFETVPVDMPTEPDA